MHFFFLLFLTLENPTFLKCPLCDRYPSHRLCTQHPLGGGRWPSLSLTVSVCVHHPVLYSSSSLAALLCFPLLPFPPFPSLLFPAFLHVGMWTRLRSLLISHVFAWRHRDEGPLWDWTVGYKASNAASVHNVAWQTDMCLCMACILRMTTVCLCYSSMICLKGGYRKATDLFLWTVSAVHVWMLWSFCVSLILRKPCPSYVVQLSIFDVSVSFEMFSLNLFCNCF